MKTRQNNQNIEFVKHKTHKVYRTHELTCVVSLCVLYPLHVCV